MNTKPSSITYIHSVFLGFIYANFLQARYVFFSFLYLFIERKENSVQNRSKNMIYVHLHLMKTPGLSHN